MSDVIRITGLTLHGYHGVLADEKRDGQRFVIDVTMHVTSRDATTPDDLTTTVNYADVAARVAEVVTGPSCDLIETLAHRIASVVLGFEGVEISEVTVHKPDAPVGLPVSDVSVTTRLTREDGQ